jgi:hypothetical protein
MIVMAVYLAHFTQRWQPELQQRMHFTKQQGRSIWGGKGGEGNISLLAFGKKRNLKRNKCEKEKIGCKGKVKYIIVKCLQIGKS